MLSASDAPMMSESPLCVWVWVWVGVGVGVGVGRRVGAHTHTRTHIHTTFTHAHPPVAFPGGEIHPFGVGIHEFSVFRRVTTPQRLGPAGRICSVRPDRIQDRVEIDLDHQGQGLLTPLPVPARLHTQARACVSGVCMYNFVGHQNHVQTVYGYMDVCACTCACTCI